MCSTLCALSLALLSFAASAAEVDNVKGTRQLVFQFSGLSDLGLAQYEGGIGMRYYLADRLAMRPGLMFSHRNMTGEEQGDYSATKDTGSLLGISIAAEKHLTSVGSISPYLGAGGGIEVRSSSREPRLPPSPPTGTALKTTAKSTDIVFFGVAGFEWYIAPHLSLGGEYRLGLTRQSGSRELTYEGRPSQKQAAPTSTEIGVSTASVLLSVGF